MKKFIYVALLAFGVALMMAPPAMAQEDKAATLHGEVRFRGEYNNNAQDFSDTADDGALYWPWRVRISAEKNFTKNVSAYIEFHNADVAGGDGNPLKSGSGDVELYQGSMTFGQLWSKNFTLQIGRQEIVAGNELLLGDLDFYAGQSHDGGVGTWKMRKVNVMVWYTRPAEGSADFVGQFGPPDAVTIASPPTTIHFLGGYASWAWKKDQAFDVYLMAVNDRGASAAFQTIGGRWAHDQTAKDGLFWSIEIAQQFGDAAPGVDASGRVLEGWVGYNWKKGKMTHRVYGRLGQATGDGDPLDSDFEGFIGLFGDFHNRTGRGDWFRLQDDTTGLGGGASGGLQAVGLGWNAYNGDRHEFGAQYWSYSLEETGTAPDDLGTALDVWYGFTYSRNVSFTASLSRLAPDDALTTVTDDSVTRFYGQARLRF